MVADCHTCGTPLDDSDIAAAGMECICHSCWEEREDMSHEEWKDKIKSLSK